MKGFLLWQFRRLQRSVGWGGIAAVGVALAAALFHFQAMLPLRADLAEMRAETDQLRARAAGRRAANTDRDPGAQLREFYRFFPEGDATTDGDAMADVMARIFDGAAQENLILEHGEYHLASTQEGGLQRYDLVLPVKGSYTKLRRFIVRVLQDNRSLALEGVSFSRHAAVDIGVNAQVRLTLYLRGGSP